MYTLRENNIKKSKCGKWHEMIFHEDYTYYIFETLYLFDTGVTFPWNIMIAT